MSRESVRQAFKRAVQSVFVGTVYTSRVTDNRDDNEYVSIFIEEGDITHNFSGSETEARITVRYCKKQPVEDGVLDVVADQVIAAIAEFPDVLAVVGRPLLESFSYEPDSQHNSINHTFRVIY